MRIALRVLGPVALGALLLGAGCSSPALKLTAAKTELCAGGYDHTELTAKVSLTGGGTKAGIVVNFYLVGDGSFSTDITYPTSSASVATDAKGEAKVTLYAGRQPGPGATVSADFTDQGGGDSASASLTIPFRAPGAGCGGAPASRSLTFTCDALNIGALRQPRPDIAVPCHVEAQTADGTRIPAEALEVKFLLEAGTMEPQTDGEGYRYFLYRPTGAGPVAVTPEARLEEPSRFDSIGVQRCPRQGLATLVAAVRGQESFDDRNANGVLDPGESFDDIGEPYVDTNDNGRFDDGEPFEDVNLDGRWNDANGAWDDDTMIWAATHILWTGPPAVDQRDAADAATHYALSANTTTITTPSSLTVSLYLRDDNLNPVAGFDGLGSLDTVSFSTTDSVITIDPISQPIKNILGFEFNPDGSIAGRSFLRDPPYRFALRTATGWVGPYTVGFSVTASPGPAGDGYFADQITDILSLQLKGQVQDPP